MQLGISVTLFKNGMKTRNTASPIFVIDQHCADREVTYFKVASFSEEACTIAEFGEKHRHDYYEIVWLKKGKGVHMIDMVNYPYNGSVVFLLSPGQIHRITPEEKASGYVLKFHPSIFVNENDADDYLINNGLFEQVEADPVVTVNAAVNAVLADLFQKMEEEFYADESDKQKILVAYLKIVLTHIDRLKRLRNSERIHPREPKFELFKQYKLLVEKNYRVEHGVQFYAQELNVQGRILNDLCRKYLNKTAGDLIADRLFLESKRELYHNVHSVKEIAYDLGFDDPAYFTRFFKKLSGFSPGEYRESLNTSRGSMKIA